MSDPQQPHDLLPLDYRAPRDEVPPVRFTAQAIIGALLTAVALVGGVFGTILLCLATNSGLAWILPCLLVTGAIVWLSVALYRNPRRRGWAVGLWIGIGLAALVEGACFYGVTR